MIPDSIVFGCKWTYCYWHIGYTTEKKILVTLHPHSSLHKLLSQCMHGPNCKLGSFCTVGRRVQEVNVLGGLILPVWGTIEKALSKQVAGFCSTVLLISCFSWHVIFDTSFMSVANKLNEKSCSNSWFFPYFHTSIQIKLRPQKAFIVTLYHSEPLWQCSDWIC